MPLEIGVNEGWKLGSESKITEKGGIELHFIQGEAITSALELLESEEPDAESHKILLFPPNIKEYGKEELRTALDIIRDLKATYKVLFKLFNLYIPKDELVPMFPTSLLTKGINLTPENQETMLTQETVVDKMFRNLGEAALELIKKEELWEKDEFRLKMLRQSPKKAFPRFTYKPDRDDWVELMVVPKEQSKVKFTAYEISKGYDDPSIAADDPTDSAADEGAFEEESAAVEDEIPTGETNVEYE